MIAIMHLMPIKHIIGGLIWINWTQFADVIYIYPDITADIRALILSCDITSAVISEFSLYRIHQYHGISISELKMSTNCIILSMLH